jgi:signal transduction histidine kinase
MRERSPDAPPADASRRGGAVLSRLRSAARPTRQPRFPTVFQSLRARLFVSFALLVLLALVMAGAVFVALHRGQSDRATLDRLAAAAPEISLELRILAERGATQQQVGDYLRQAAHDRGLRILLVDWRDGTIVDDSNSSLRGKHLALPSPLPFSTGGSYRVLYRSWRGTTPETRNLTFLVPVYGRAIRDAKDAHNPESPPLDQIALPPPAQDIAAGGPGAGQIAVLAVSQETTANAWLGLLPGLGWAGLAALALSALMAGLLSRSIARPLLALTRASEELARGNFDQVVAVSRPDELGRLADAFNAMARETGRSQLQMRALIADVSHDLKTPLTSILGFAQALRDGEATDPAEVQELTGIIFEEADRIFAIVQDLLYLSQLEAGEMLLTPTRINLADLGSRSLRRLEPLLRERGLTLDARLDPAAEVVGDAGKIQRILDNLLDNARKYTPAGGRIMLLIAGSENFEGVHLSVHNTGSYISAEEAGRVFDRFYRADRSRTSAMRGSGLGLAIVKELVALHQGEIEVTSTLEYGTSFIVTLPNSTHAVGTQHGCSAAEPAAPPTVREASVRRRDLPWHDPLPLLPKS